MSLETTLYTTIAALCPRVFPDVAPATTATPYVTWQQIGGTAFSFTEGALPDKRNARIMVQVWAKSRIEAVTLSQQIEAALCASTAFTAEPESAMVARVDDDTDLRGAMQDFSIWADR